ncbi:urea carboxylase [soil metagenome]
MSLFKKVLIANRGEIACRVIRTLQRMGIQSVAVYSEADAGALHVDLADEAVCIGPAAARESYLNGAHIIEVALQTGAQAVHPGYGFLSENAAFAEACEAAGLAFIGPTPDQMRRFGLKHTSRELAGEAKVPLLPGTGLLDSLEQALELAAGIGYPIMLKSTAGGGGIGMRVCYDEAELATHFDSVSNLGKNNFSDGGVYLEKFVQKARHVEVQIFGDGAGGVIQLGERDCSTQRRNQKVIEETPAPDLTEPVREELLRSAVALGKSISYRSAGTVEFVYDADEEKFYFLEVNTRLQVEHGVTELVTGLDLVEWMVRLAAGEILPVMQQTPQRSGHAMQVRLYSEDPQKNFAPSSGLLTDVSFPEDARCDYWVATGTEVTPFYDPLLAKLLVHGATREEALSKMESALEATRLEGLETNRDYLMQVVRSPEFATGKVWTKFLDGFAYAPRTIEVLDGGTQTTVQDYPGRTGYWAIGVPPSGPMDSLSFRLGNRLLGNDADAAGLECTMSGPTLKFHTATTLCLTGAKMIAALDGVAVDYYQAVSVQAGQILKLGRVEGEGARTYLTVRGGFDVPLYLGSRATFTLGQFGGHGGRALRVGDILKLQLKPLAEAAATVLPEALKPVITHDWEIGVLYGPHGAPDFFTDKDIDTFFATEWKIHYNSARTGVRLVGPKPEWARTDGGEAGLHPSNLHDNAYAIGAVDFTGDMPILLGPDGPSLGGFVCPAVIVQAELWKMGQLSPGDTVKFKRLTMESARALAESQEASLRSLKATAQVAIAEASLGSPIVLDIPAEGERVALRCRIAGDAYLLIEYGPLELDFKLRFRVHELMAWLEKKEVPGIIDCTPGIRSLQLHYDPVKVSLDALLALIVEAEEVLPPLSELEVPARIVHLPLAWDDSQTRLAIEKYMQSVRPDAPWCPSNLEFIRRINDLESIEQVKEMVYSASYLVMGLGDVYLGAPVAVPMDPRHRLVTTKYNPARTWTPENAVGIGGAYMCVYGMEGPGGYQFVGRTVQMWNRWRVTPEFPKGKPWLLRFFDQIRFYPVTEEALLQHREDFTRGCFGIRIEETTFRWADYEVFLNSIADETAIAKTRQQAAFQAERERWAAMGIAEVPSEDESNNQPVDSGACPEGCIEVKSSLSANVWQIAVEEGQTVIMNDRLVVLEAMKMEIAVSAPEGGIVEKTFITAGRMVTPGQTLFWLRTL